MENLTVESIKQLREAIKPTSLTFVKSSLHREWLKNKELFETHSADIVDFLLTQIEK